MKPFFQTIRVNRIKYWRFFLFYAAAAFAISACEILTTHASGGIGQSAVTGNLQSITGFLIFMTIVTGIQMVLKALSVLFSKRFSGKTGYHIRENFIRHFLSIPFSALSKKNSGSLLSLYANDLPASIELITDTFFQLTAGMASLIVSAVYMAVINPWMTLIFYIMYPPLVILQVAISQPLQRHMVNVSARRADFNAIVNDALQNTSTIAAYSLEDVMEARYLSGYDAFYQTMLKYVKALATLVISGIMVTFLPLAFVYVTAAFSVISGRMTVGDFIVITTIATTANSWLMMLSQQLAGFQAKSASASQLLENMSDAPESNPDSSTVSIQSPLTPALSFENVNFSYSDEKAVLSNISFSIQPGSKTAIVGGSGSGKSTLLKLMLGLYTADGGTISVFGNDIKDMTKEDLRDRIAYVPQDCFMFPDTIRQNITCVKPAQPDSDTRLRAACQSAGILDFIESLPNGFDTVLNESAENVSGGQRQRLAIARALYKDAPVVLFDEATSALDPATEKAVLDTFYSSMAGKTAIVIAHRPAAIQACDRILVMKDGRLVAEEAPGKGADYH